MKVLVIGASGYIGSTVVEKLLAGGHQVVALSREPGAHTYPAGVDVRHGDLAEPATLTVAVTADIDGVVNLATPAADPRSDLNAAAALLQPLEGSGRFLVYTSGVWVLGRTGSYPVDEDAAPNPIELVKLRPAIERQVLAAAERGVRAVVIRPGITYGRGSGIPRMLVDLARENGAARYVGGPDVHWPMVHVDDLADLFVAAVERARPAALLHGVDEEAVHVASLAAAAAQAAGVPEQPTGWPVADAGVVLGQGFAEALALHQVVSGDRARRQLGWRPRSGGAIRDVASGSYAA